MVVKPVKVNYIGIDSVLKRKSNLKYKLCKQKTLEQEGESIIEYYKNKKHIVSSGKIAW